MTEEARIRPLVGRELPEWFRGIVRAPSWRSWQWLVLLALGVLASVLGAAGYARAEPAMRGTDIAYATIKLFGFSVEGDVEVDGFLEVARWLAPLVAGYTALAALVELSRERLRMIALGGASGHVVVAGLGDKGFAFVTQLRAAGRSVVAIERDPVAAHVEAARRAGALVLIGDARDPAVLRAARVPTAAHLVVVTADEPINATIALSARSLVLARRGRPLHCLAHIDDPELLAPLREVELDGFESSGGVFELKFFNVGQIGARALLEELAPYGVADGRDLVLVGGGRLLREVASLVASTWAARDVRTVVITWVGTGPDSEAPVLEGSSGLRVHLLERGDALQGATLAGHLAAIIESSPSKQPVIVVHCGDDASSLALAMQLRGLSNRGVPVFAGLTVGSGLGELFRGGEAGALRMFSVLAAACDVQLLDDADLESLARLRHEAYVRERRVAGETPSTNASLLPWSELPASLRRSNRAQVAAIRDKLALIGAAVVRSRGDNGFAFGADEIELLARAEHERFVAERRADGWVYAPGAKDAAAKTSPTLVPWSELDETEREKDRDAVRDIPRLLAAAGYAIVRTRTARTVSTGSR